MRKPSSGATAWKVAVSGLLLLVVITAVRPEQLLHELRRVEAGRLGVIVFLSWCGQLLCVQRWRLFAARLGMEGSYSRFLRMYFVGMFFNVGLPSLVGGDLVKAYLVGKTTGRPLQCGLASVLQDRAAGLISLLLCGSAAAAACSLTWRGIPIRSMYLIAWVGVAGALWVVWKGAGLYERSPRPGAATLPRRVLSLVADLHQGLAGVRLSRGGVLQVTVYSIVNSSLSIWLLQQIGGAAGHPVPLLGFSALLPLITLATLLPVTVGGLGIREWAYVEGLALLDLPASAALLVALTTSAVLVAADLAGAVFLPAIPAQLRAELRNPSPSGRPESHVDQPASNLNDRR